MLLMEAVALVSGALVTIVLGTPLAVRLARPGSWKKRAAPDLLDAARASGKNTAFKPIDMGPDRMTWPSERKDEWPNLTSPPWPSAGWDDEHFGKRAPAEFVPAYDEVEAAPAEPPRPKATGQRGQLRPTDARVPVPAVTSTALQPVVPTSSPEPVMADRAPLLAEPPAPAELQFMVEQEGLAATVKVIMERTGWDFRQAAQHLARIRSR